MKSQMKVDQTPVSVAADFILQNKFGHDQINLAPAWTWIDKKGDYIKFGIVRFPFSPLAARSQPRNLVHFFTVGLFLLAVTLCFVQIDRNADEA